MTTLGHQTMAVSDSPTSLEIMWYVLKKNGISADFMLGPLAALQHFKEKPSGYSMVISDNAGNELAREIKSIRNDVKFVVMSESDMVCDAHEVDSVIAKPLFLEDMEKAVLGLMHPALSL
jgi:hypothetical protein